MADLPANDQVGLWDWIKTIPPGTVALVLRYVRQPTEGDARMAKAIAEATGLPCVGLQPDDTLDMLGAEQMRQAGWVPAAEAEQTRTGFLIVARSLLGMRADRDRARRVAVALEQENDHLQQALGLHRRIPYCCDGHVEPTCCDVNDCGPCCPDCPSCPALAKGRPGGVPDE